MITNLMKNIQIEQEYICEKLGKHPFLTAVGANLLFFLFALLFCEIKYETSDDYVMSTIMAGAYTGTPNPHMIFINILWGYILLPFYNLLPQISWYLISQLFLCFCSFVAVTYLLLKKLDTIMAIMLFVLFITFFSNDVYIVVQFTKTAILTVMAGSILFLDALFYEGQHNKKQLIVGGGLVFAGSLIRFNVIYIAGGFLLILLLVEVIKLIYYKKCKRIGKVAFAGAILIGLVIGAKGVDQLIYNQSPEYKYFRTYGEARGNIIDKRDDGYEACAEEYQKIGISENDYRMLQTWNFADPDFFTLERIQKVQKIIADYQDNTWLDRDSIKDVMSSRNYWAYPSLWGCAALILLSIFFNKRYWWISLLSMCTGYLYLYYFAASGKLVYRVEYGVLLSAFLLTVFYWNKIYCRKAQNKLEICNICVIISVLLCLYQLPIYRLNPWSKMVTGEEYKNYIEERFFDSWDYDSRRYRDSAFNKNAFSNLRDEVKGNEDNFYFLNFSTTVQTLYLQYNPWINEQETIWKNTAGITGVAVNHPDILKQLKNRNVENPIKSLLNEDVYLIDNFFHNEMLDYIKEHYYPNARKELYKTLDGFQIWKFYEK